jgi:hypothetical protein
MKILAWITLSYDCSRTEGILAEGTDEARKINAPHAIAGKW